MRNRIGQRQARFPERWTVDFLLALMFFALVGIAFSAVTIVRASPTPAVMLRST